MIQFLLDLVTLLLSILLGLLLVSMFLAKPLLAWLRQYFVTWRNQGDLILLWGGLILSAIGFGALLLYLALHQFYY